MVRVICDTSFLMILASKKIKNISSLETEIGDLELVVPDLVVGELKRLSKTNGKKKVLHLMH
ncbi:MAG: hypothetical protein KGH89_00700 [Thaumarchaeota archaeon]|nr:hypothetical protein [Nitrososphaerota archaeon]MDE1866384.1 hypothetical protein [Nitrososphaerota archaeon]